jgi:hypothetical protein
VLNTFTELRVSRIFKDLQPTAENQYSAIAEPATTDSNPTNDVVADFEQLKVGKYL